jgi:MFS family permease
VNPFLVQRRTVRTLMVSSALGYFGFLSVAAIVGLLSAEILGSDSLAGLPAAAETVGAALAAAPLALRSKRLGRRRSLAFGYAIGGVGAVMSLVSGQQSWFWLLVVGMLGFGVSQAVNLQSRFAAADLAVEDETARPISLVVWVGTIGAILGPVAALWANRVGLDLGLRNWVGPLMLGIVGVSAAAVVVQVWLRPDPLVLAGGVDADSAFENPLKGALRSVRVIWPNQRARLAIVAMAVSHMAMVAVMVMTPLHMRDYGHADLSTVVVSVHVLGMFGLSPLIGGWADRFGRIRTIALGAVILGTGTVAAVVAGYVPALMFAGLFLLGLGWSFALIAGSALLTESLPIEQRVPAQGVSDLAMNLLGAIAALASGFVKDLAGFQWLAHIATAGAILILISAVGVSRRTRRVLME